jgi:hypothetical protein
MSDANESLALFSIDGTRLGPVTVSGTDVVFPDASVRWVWVLDARPAPYPDLERATVFERAQKVRKRYVLMADTSATAE